MKFKTVTPLPNPSAPVCPPNVSCPPRNMTVNIWGLGGGSGDPLIPEYQTILNYATSQGWQLPSAPVQDLQNTLLELLIGHGIWDQLDVFYNFLTDGDANFAKINWKNPGVGNAVGSSTFIPFQGFLDDASLAVLSPGGGGKEQAEDVSCFFGIPAYVFGADNTIPSIGISINSDAPFRTRSATTFRMRLQTVYNTADKVAPFTQVILTGVGSTVTQYINNVLQSGTFYGGVAAVPSACTIFGGSNSGGNLIDHYGRGASLSGKESDLYSEWASYKSGIGEFKAKNVYPFEMT